MAHAGVGTCNLNNNWTWTSQTCRPRFSCLANASIDTTHAHIFDPSELPNSFTLDHDYTYTLVDDDTPDKCEYVCDSGFTRDGNTCIPLVCSGQKPANAISCNNVIKAENFVPLQAGSLKTGFWRFDTFLPLPDTYTPNSNYLSGLILPAPAV